MTPTERAVLEAIVGANGLLPAPELRKDVLRRMGLDGSRTRGFTRILEQTLQRLTRARYIAPRTGGRPTPRNKHASVVGREIKHHKVGCCTVTEDEQRNMEHIKTYNCVYYEATDAGRNALRV